MQRCSGDRNAASNGRGGRGRRAHARPRGHTAPDGDRVAPTRRVCVVCWELSLGGAQCGRRSVGRHDRARGERLVQANWDHPTDRCAAAAPCDPAGAPCRRRLGVVSRTALPAQRRPGEPATTPQSAPEVRGTCPVDAAASACLAVRADRFVAVTGFDPRFVDHRAGEAGIVRMADPQQSRAGCVGPSQVVREPGYALSPSRRPSSSRISEDNDDLCASSPGRPSGLGLSARTATSSPAY